MQFHIQLIAAFCAGCLCLFGELLTLKTRRHEIPFELAAKQVEIVVTGWVKHRQCLIRRANLQNVSSSSSL